MYKIVKIDESNVKSRITEEVLRLLPEWFGMESGIQIYVNGVSDKDFFAAYDGDKIIGFTCLVSHNKYTSEIYVMGVLKDYHRSGIGHRMLTKAEQFLRDRNYKYLMVKTIGDSCKDKNYRNTREFYSGVGFYPLEEIKELWDENNPCLIMVKNI